MESYTLERWAEYVIERWENKIVALNIQHTGDLLRSFQSEVYMQSGGDKAKIVFAFNYYGKFVDMGVGKGVKLENYFSTQHNRRRKMWYSPTFHSQLHKLAEIIARNYSRAAILTIQSNKKDNSSVPFILNI